MCIDKAKEAKIKEALSYRNGTDNWYKFSLCGNLYTDGVKEMAELCKADWLVTDALVMCKHLSKSNDFIVVNFKYTPKLKSKGIEAIVTYDNGNDTIIHKELIMVTDFPLEEFKMFYENEVLCLPSER